MTFKKFISCFTEVDLPIGDLARDIQGDSKFPDSFDKEVLYRHLKNSHACQEALSTFENAFAYYRLEYPEYF